MKIQDIDALLRFLTIFEQPKRNFEAEWYGGEKQDDGAFTTPYPIYPRNVNEFFHLASQPCWADYNYNPEEAGKMLADEEFIKKASLPQIKTMLTFCVRGERFCYGHWGVILASGRIVLLLKRLKVLKNNKKTENEYREYEKELKERFKDYGKRNFREYIEPGRNFVFQKKYDEKNLFQEHLSKHLPEGEKHKWFRSMKSSQALVVSVFATLKERSKLNIIEKAVVSSEFSDTSAVLELEKKVDFLGEPRPTSLDVFMESENAVIAGECKLTEKEFGQCSYYTGGKCNGNHTKKESGHFCPLEKRGVLYWEKIPEIFDLQNNREYSPCPIREFYQLYRVILAAGAYPIPGNSQKERIALFIYDERNPYWAKRGSIRKVILKTASKIKLPHLKVKILSWQQFAFKLARDPEMKDLVLWLEDKYGIVPIFKK